MSDSYVWVPYGATSYLLQVAQGSGWSWQLSTDQREAATALAVRWHRKGRRVRVLERVANVHSDWVKFERAVNARGDWLTRPDGGRWSSAYRVADWDAASEGGQEEPGRCGFFLRCAEPAVGVLEHPVLDGVPTCAECAEDYGFDVKVEG